MKEQIQKYLEPVLSKLKPTPKGFSACCPKHSERTPSFHISLEKGMCKCFGCGFFQPLFTFLTENGVPYDIAVEFLFFDYKSESKENKELTEYILGRKVPLSMINRGFNVETLQHFRVGYDEQSERITIPLEVNGKLIGIAYRRPPKHFSYEGGFNRDTFIYNFCDNDEAVLVEGFTDTWMVWQNGVECVEATLGAEASEGQVAILSRHKRLWLAYDNDFPGYLNMYRIHNKLRSSCDIGVVPYAAHDPGSCDTAIWSRAMGNRMTFLEFELAMIKRNKELYDTIQKQLKYG